MDISAPLPAHRDRLKELDALRGLGALTVALYHYTTRFHEIFPKAPHIPYAFANTDYRVLLFFAISGFSIFFSFRRLTHGSDFIVGRMIRLLPAFWVAMTLTLMVELVAKATSLLISPLAIIANIFMIQAFFFLPSVDGAYWTLTVEICFYASVLGLWKLNGLRHVERLILGWLVLRVIWWAVPDLPERFIMLTVLRFIPFFAIGMLAYRVWQGERTWKQQIPILAPLLAVIYAVQEFDEFVFCVLMCGLFYAMIRGWLRFLCVRPLLWLGSISYPLYLVHQHIGFIVMLHAQKIGLGPWGALALAIGLGALIHYTVETPATRILSRLWKNYRARPAPVPATA